MDRIKAKEVALKVLRNVETRGAYANLALKKELRPLDAGGRALATELVYGVLRWQGTLDYFLAQLASRPLGKIPPVILTVLRIGLYQALFMPSVPEAVAVNEAVIMARRFGHKGTAAFVNGLLRAVLRKDRRQLYPSKQDTEEYLAARYSHPRWLVQEWLDYLGREETEALCEANNQVAPTTIRVNTLLTSGQELEAELTTAGVEVKAGKYLPEARVISGYPPLEKMPAFAEGKFSVQDEGSMLIARLVDPRPGEMIYDLCAAPGGKTAHLAALMGNSGQIIAVDPHPHKIKLLEKAMSRLGVGNTALVLGDGRKLPEEHTEKADAVLVDAPCSGLGVLRRKPEIKWRRRPQDITSLVKLQRELLAEATRYLRPGGRLVYSTCTLTSAENEKNVAWLKKANPALTALDPRRLLPAAVQDKLRPAGDGCLLLPHRTGTDGFFLALLQKDRY